MPDQFQVSGANAIQAGTTAPEWVMWMPGGKHEINASKSGKPCSLTVNVVESDAAKLQAELSARTGPKAFIGFDHNPGARAAVPVEFAWKTTPEPGIYLRCRWTPEGKRAVSAEEGESANYGYFSPTFMADEKGNVTGLPATGEIGSLVNNPAFRRMLPVAASQSSTDNSMTEAEIAALQAENARLKTEKEAVSADLKKQKEATAAAAVSAAVDAGKIAPQDTATQEFWKASLFEKPDSKAVLEALPVRFKVNAASVGGQSPVNAGQEPVNGNAVRARANDILNAARIQGRCISWQQAWGAACAEADLLPSNQAVTAAA